MIEVKLHDIGEGMTEADINCFLIKAGDVVKADDPLVEVQTDKMTAEIPAPRAGVVKEFLVKPGQTVTVGATLLILEAADSAKDVVTVTNAPAHSSAKTEKTAAKVEKLSFTTNKIKRVLASPYTRKIAREHQVDLELLVGTGPAGRITDEDVYQFIQHKNETSSKIEPTIKQTETKVEHSEPKVQQQEVTAKTIPFRGRRKMIAQKMAQSLYTIPHCTHFEEIDVTALIKFRNDLKSMKQNISATAFFLKALSISLKEFPIFNAELDEMNEQIQLKNEHHIGIAVDTKDGLIVPVIRNIEQKSIRTIHQEMKELTQKALEDRLTIKEITGGTFTISNVGPLGGSIGATPIIQHPEVALVSFHKTKKMPVVTDDDQIVIRSIMNLSMSFDHRVADGATAVAFTNRFSQLIQNPNMLLLELI